MDTYRESLGGRQMIKPFDCTHYAGVLFRVVRILREVRLGQHPLFHNSLIDHIGQFSIGFGNGLLGCSEGAPRWRVDHISLLIKLYECPDNSIAFPKALSLVFG